MRKQVLLVAALALATWVAIENLASRDDESEFSTVASDSGQAVWKEPDIVNSLAQAVSSEFEFDGSRLYDISYEIDPALTAFAKSIGKSPACVIQLVKLQVEKSDVALDSCSLDRDTSADAMVVVPGSYETVCKMQGGREYCRRVKVGDHPYEKYSDDQLRSLAESSPEAAVILARRLPDDEQSESYYEKAVALSGRPGPLEEWMLHRNLGGLVHVDGVLDVDKAILGYEIYLTTNRLGGYGASALPEYERVLLDANIDLAPVKDRAERRFARLTDARQAIVGTQWEG